MRISGYSGVESYYEKLSSGRRINKAADDAAGLSIAEKLESQSNGLDVGASNAATSNDMLNIAEGALGSITDSLQRIRELGVQAANGIYGEDELSYMQEEIDQLKYSISDTIEQTQFNGMNLLDGSMDSTFVATGPNGDGKEIGMPGLSLASLGIEDFDVTGSFDISAIDSAIKTVSKSRGSLGAASNGLQHTINYNQYASQNLTASRSRIEDLDYGKAITDFKKNQVIEQYKMMMEKKKMQQNEDGMVRLMFQM